MLNERGRASLFERELWELPYDKKTIPDRLIGAIAALASGVSHAAMLGFEELGQQTVHLQQAGASQLHGCVVGRQ